ncbi:MAG TPA: twin-arginine translocase TatA/TatE family subunit [Bryobacteraceae bacterium]|nr:twin-arginine translocase TatA/TatE family subunit [Bryobacteraceae bacterium]
MGPLGWQETVFIFVLALLIFGPKKLPELGRTIGKALTEFRRASSELKSTFHEQMASIERENQELKEVTQKYSNEISGYQYDSYYDSGYYGEGSDTSTSKSSDTSAAAVTGAESDNGTVTAATEETIARTSEPAAAAPAETEPEKHAVQS